MRALHAHDAVDFAEPNWRSQRAAVSNDTDYTNGPLWDLYGDLTIAGKTVTGGRLNVSTY